MEIKNYFKFRNEVGTAPLRILRQKTKQLFATKLDSRKLLLTENHFHRDWRGLAEIAELETSVIRSGKISYTEHCFHLWIQKGGAVIQNLWKALENMDRFDVIEDTLTAIYEDYDYATNNNSLGFRPVPPIYDEDMQSSINIYDSNVLTTDDQKNLSDGGTLQFYDALVLFSDEDLSFVEEMVQKLEGEYNMKLVLKDRDLVGGLTFELSAVVRLIKERCARVIVVLSPAFLESEENKFLTQFTSNLSVEQQRRILIPCRFKPCEKPFEISFYHSLDYFRLKDHFDFWKRLADSVSLVSDIRAWNRNTSAVSTPVVREFAGPSHLALTSPLSSSPRPAAFPRSLPSSPVSQTSPVHGIFNRLRRRTEGVKADKKKHIRNSEATEKEKRSSSSSSLFLTPPDSSLNGGEDGEEDKSIYSSGGSRSPPTSSTFSTAPLLDHEHSSHQNGPFRTILKKVKNLKKKKEVAL